MAKTWVLETHTKGTGANIVPLDDEREQRPADASSEPIFVARKRTPRPPEQPKPKAPSRFRVVEVTTHRTLADDADARATIEALRDVASVVDVAIWVRSEKDGRWRLLTHGEQKALWDLRDRLARA